MNRDATLAPRTAPRWALNKIRPQFDPWRAHRPLEPAGLKAIWLLLTRLLVGWAAAEALPPQIGQYLVQVVEHFEAKTQEFLQ